MHLVRRCSAVVVACCAVALVPAPAQALDPTDVLKALGSTAAEELGGVALGSILSKYGLGPATAEQLRQVQEQLAQLHKGVERLEEGQRRLAARIAESTLSLSISQTHRLTTAIDTEEAELLAITHIHDPVMRDARTRALIARLGSREFLDAPGAFEKFLTGAGGAISIITAANAVSAADHRFYTHTQSAQARAVVSYFDLYQAQALHLVLEYRKAHPELFSTQENINYIAGWQKRQRDQRHLLKPLVPEGLQVDTTTGLGWYFGAVNTFHHWSTNFPHPKVPVSDRMLGIYRVYHPIVPTGAQLSSVASGWGGGSAITWLQHHAGFPTPAEKGDFGYAYWTKDTFNKTQCVRSLGPVCVSSTQAPYTNVGVFEKQCFSNNSFCTPDPGGLYQVPRTDGKAAAVAYVEFQPQNYWHYPPPLPRS